MNLPIYELEISEDLNDDIEVNVVSLVKRPAIKKNFLAFNESNPLRFAVQDQEQRIISGPIMLADTPIYRKDKTGEYYVTFSKETISKIVQVFFKKGYQSSVNLMHDGQNFVEGVTMFESWITNKERGIEPMKGFEDAPEGSWFGSFKVDNDQVWERVKIGDFEGFSVEGAFLMSTKKKDQKTKDQEAFEKVMEILAKVDEFYDPNQERDESGRWGSGGGSAKSDPESAPAPKIAKVERDDERITKLMGSAKESGAEVDKVGKDIASKYDGVLTPINYKSDESIARKVNDELNGDVSQVKDAVRNTAVVSYDKLDGIAKDLASEPRFQAENGGRVKIQEGPEYYGYKGIITNYRTENGTMAETQVNSPGMIYAKVSKEDALKVMSKQTYDKIEKATGKPGGMGHRYYEIIRKIDPQTASPARIAVRNEVIKRSTEYYKSFYGF